MVRTGAGLVGRPPLGYRRVPGAWSVAEFDGVNRFYARPWSYSRRAVRRFSLEMEASLCREWQTGLICKGIPDLDKARTGERRKVRLESGIA